MGSSEDYGIVVPRLKTTTSTQGNVCSYAGSTSPPAASGGKYRTTGSSSPYVLAQSDSLLTTTASYPSSMVNSVADRLAAQRQPLYEASTAPRCRFSPPPKSCYPPSPPCAKLSPSAIDENENRTINYEELKMKISYKKFERECIMGEWTFYMYIYNVVVLAVLLFFLLF